MAQAKNPIISAIVAMGQNRVIGRNNQLPWHLPADLKHFKELTTGHPILMGRKTYESIGKPLPNRTNIIMTQNDTFQAPHCIIVKSIQDALMLPAVLNSQEMFIIGGARIYQLWLPSLTRIYLTVVQHEFAGDTYFPELNLQEWQENECEKHDADVNNPYAYQFVKLERI